MIVDTLCGGSLCAPLLSGAGEVLKEQHEDREGCSKCTKRLALPDAVLLTTIVRSALRAKKLDGNPSNAVFEQRRAEVHYET